MSATWTERDAIDLIRRLEPELAVAGWHVGLTGGVLRRGQSDHDLDLIVFPHKKRRGPRPGYRKLRRALASVGMTQTWSRRAVQKNWAERGIRDGKWVEIWQALDGRRIDVLVLS